MTFAVLNAWNLWTMAMYEDSPIQRPLFGTLVPKTMPCTFKLIYPQSYDQQSSRSALDADPNFRWCRGPSCEAGQVHEGGETQPIVRCVNCGFRTCFRHQEPWHEGMTCEKYDAMRRDPDAFQAHIETQEQSTLASQHQQQQHQARNQGDAARRRHEAEQRKAAVNAMRQRAREEEASRREVGRASQPCPGCKRPIQKRDGCDHMKCSQCRYEFCYKCLANYERIRWFGNSAHRSSCTHHR